MPENSRPAHPFWFDFLAAVNSRLLKIYQDCRQDHQAASAQLHALLKEILQDDKRVVTWTSDNPPFQRGQEVSVSQILDTEPLISPFVFWSFIFSNQGQRKDGWLQTVIGRLQEYFEISSPNPDTAREIIYPHTLEGWLQNIADIQDGTVSCWQLFELLLRENWTKDDINPLIKALNPEKNNGIGAAGIHNLLFFIRPDLSFSISGRTVTAVENYPAYWNEAAWQYMENIYRKRGYSQCSKDDSVTGLRQHYEFIVNGETGVKGSPYKIYTEFHVEPKRNAGNNALQLCQMLEQRLQNINDGQISKRQWQKNGLAVRYGSGVSVLDLESGLGRSIETVRNELQEQMDHLHSILDGTLQTFLLQNSYEGELLEKRSLLESAKQLILTGAPGTGKTFTAKQLAEKWIEETGGTLEENFCQVQFHPGYDYADFIIGLKPQLVKERVSFAWENGIFKSFADKARRARDAEKEQPKPYIFLIDEINRADLSRVFGEVFSLLEEDYRYPKNKSGIKLPDRTSFILPDNLYIIATMNDIDRSVESMDFALRRRFSFLEVTAKESVVIIEKKEKISEADKQKLIASMAELNKYIGSENELLDGKYRLDLGNEYQLGGAYFVHFAKYLDEPNPQVLLWENHLQIILGEYLRGHRDRYNILQCLKDKFDFFWSE